MSPTGCEPSVWNATRRHSARMTSAPKYWPTLTADDLKEIGVACRRPSAPAVWWRSPSCEQRTADTVSPMSETVSSTDRSPKRRSRLANAASSP